MGLGLGETEIKYIGISLHINLLIIVSFNYQVRIDSV